MFTGIVQGKGRILSISEGESVWTFVIALPDVQGLARGASVAINGVCLTATEIDGSNVAFDVIQETLQRTNLSNLSVEDTVNVERSLKMGDELGGPPFVRPHHGPWRYHTQGHRRRGGGHDR